MLLATIPIYEPDEKTAAGTGEQMVESFEDMTDIFKD
jgi:hypothetical protein